MKVDKAKMIYDAVDRRRRDVIQQLKDAKGEASEMYYEGMRVAFTEMQSFAKELAAIGELK